MPRPGDANLNPRTEARLNPKNPDRGHSLTIDHVGAR
jgi:hypothetical protein